MWDGVLRVRRCPQRGAPPVRAIGIKLHTHSPRRRRVLLAASAAENTDTSTPSFASPTLVFAAIELCRGGSKLLLLAAAAAVLLLLLLLLLPTAAARAEWRINVRRFGRKR